MTHDVIVIGGGLAGVIAAREVARSGRSVLLVEARDRLGGRTWYKRDALNGLSLEMGGTWIDPSHALVQAEVRRYRLDYVGALAVHAPGCLASRRPPPLGTAAGFR